MTTSLVVGGLIFIICRIGFPRVKLWIFQFLFPGLNLYDVFILHSECALPQQDSNSNIFPHICIQYMIFIMMIPFLVFHRSLGDAHAYLLN